MKSMNVLGDFHLHTTFSDGRLPMREVIDLYGKSGFNAIAITDHLCESKTFLGVAANFLDRTLTKDNFSYYIDKIKEEGERARFLYDMTVIPGVEITKNSFRHSDSAHVVALGVDKYIDPNKDLFDILSDISNQGGLSIAAHPVSTRKLEPQTLYLWHHRYDFCNYFDAWEVASGPHLFQEVKESPLPMIANSDMHHPAQIKSWKTEVQCSNEQWSILEAIKKQKVEFRFFDPKSFH